MYVCAVVAMAMSVMFVACKDKNSPSGGDDSGSGGSISGCSCTVYEDGEKVGTEKITIEQMEEYYDVTTCSKLQSIVNNELEEEGISMRCSSY